MLKQELRMYEKQFHIIRQSQHHIRSLKHDMKHHIKMLSDLVAAGEKTLHLNTLRLWVNLWKTPMHMWIPAMKR